MFLVWGKLTGPSNEKTLKKKVGVTEPGGGQLGQPWGLAGRVEVGEEGRAGQGAEGKSARSPLPAAPWGPPHSQDSCLPPLAAARVRREEDGP